VKRFYGFEILLCPLHEIIVTFVIFIATLYCGMRMDGRHKKFIQNFGLKKFKGGDHLVDVVINHCIM
jgi:hypothetical protein